MDTLVVVLIVVAVVGFVLWRVGALKSLIDKKPSALEPAPVLPPVDVVPPPTWVTPSGPGTGTPTISRPLSQFEMLVAQGLDLETITRRVGRALTPEELAYARAHNVPGSAVVAQPVPAGGSVTDYEDPAFDWTRPNSPRIFRNGTTKTLTVPAGFKGSVILHNGDMGGNVADYCVLTMSGPNFVGAQMSWPTRYQAHTIDVMPGTYTFTANADKPLVMSVRFEPVPA